MADYSHLLPYELRDKELFKLAVELLNHIDELGEFTENSEYPESLAVKVFSTYNNVEAVLAYFYNTLSNSVGTIAALKYIAKLSGVAANVVEWWMDPRLPRFGLFIQVLSSDLDLIAIKSFLDLVLLFKNERTRIVALGEKFPTEFCLEPESEIKYSRWDENRYEAYNGLTYKGVAITVADTLPTILVNFPVTWFTSDDTCIEFSDNKILTGA